MKVRFLLFFVLISSFLQAQNLTNLRHKFFLHLRDSVVLDSMMIVPGSVVVYSKHRPLGQEFRLVWYKSLLIVSRPLDSVHVYYRVFDIPVKSLILDTSVRFLPTYSELVTENIPEVKDLAGGLHTDGHITRGVMFGTNSEPSLSSDMNLRLSGNLTPSVKIEAVVTNSALSDQQVEQTYTLRDFDRALINVYFPSSQLKAGDLDLRLSTGYFLRYRRSLKGIFFRGSDGTKSYFAGLGVQKGFFRRQKIQGQDGNQGPYRLTGVDGNQFIVIVSGSERVFVDGVLKRRGLQHDYVIDYNKAELTFTPNCMITRDSRIIVEFEYWNLDFLRFSWFGGYSQKVGNDSLFVGFLHVSDNLASVRTVYNSAQMKYLWSLGDSVEHAQWLMADSIGLDTSAMYCKRDTLWQGKHFTIFVYSPQKECAVWRVRFYYVGQGKGDYVLADVGLNERVFRWVGPNNGDYSPIRPLLAPQKREVFVVGGKFRLGKQWFVDLDLASGIWDKNLLSPLNDKDNLKLNLGISLSKMEKHTTLGIGYRLLNRDFPVFDRFLPVEFERDWNLRSPTAKQWHWFRSWYKLNRSDYSVNTLAQLLFLPENYRGTKFDLNFLDTAGKLRIISWISANHTYQQGYRTEFWRGNVRLLYVLGRFSAGISADGENNQWLQNELLLPTSYSYLQFGPLLRLGDSTRGLLQLAVNHRVNSRSVDSSRFLAYYKATDFSINYWQRTSRQLRQLRLTYRLTHTDTSVLRNILAQSRWTYRAKRLGLSLFYQTQSGEQPVKQFVFVEVPAGRGQYAWIDFNHDGRQQLNEFQFTPYTELARYIRTVLPLARYINVVGHWFRFSIWTMPFKSSLRNELTFDFEQKDKNSFFSFQPLTDTLVIYTKVDLRNRLSFRLNQRIAFLWVSGFRQNKDLLAGGFQSLRRLNSVFSVTYRPARIFRSIISWEIGDILSSSQLFVSGNYGFWYHTPKVELVYVRGSNTAKAEMSYKRKQVEGTGNLSIFAAGVEYNQQVSRRFRGEVRLRYLRNNLAGHFDAQLQYVLLEGYEPGNNLLINFSGLIGLFPKFNLELGYNLRFTTSGIVHTFNFQLTGLF